MTDLKHINHPNRRAADRTLDGFFTGIAWLIATLLTIFYGLGVMP